MGPVCCAEAEGGSFQEAGGTGMGAGEGAKDVSDQIQDEDQLLGARQKDQAPEQVGCFTAVLCTLHSMHRLSLQLGLDAAGVAIGIQHFPCSDCLCHKWQLT